jgi:hypothetical protein
LTQLSQDLGTPVPEPSTLLPLNTSALGVGIDIESNGLEPRLTSIPSEAVTSGIGPPGICPIHMYLIPIAKAIAIGIDCGNGVLHFS